MVFECGSVSMGDQLYSNIVGLSNQFTDPQAMVFANSDNCGLTAGVGSFECAVAPLKTVGEAPTA